MNNDKEKAILARLYRDGLKAWKEVEDAVDERWFSKDVRRAFGILRRLAADGREWNLEYIAEIKAPLWDEARFYVDSTLHEDDPVSAGAFRSSLIDYGKGRIGQWLAEHPGCRTEEKDRAIFALQNIGQKVEGIHLDEAWYDSLASRNGRGRPFNTGIGSVQRICGGIRAGELWVVAGRVSNGKSCLSVGIAANCLRNGGSVLYADYEMGDEQCAARLAAQEHAFDVRHFLRRGDSDSIPLEVQKAERGIAQWAVERGKQIRYLKSPPLSGVIREIRTRPYDVVVVDYIQQAVSGLRGRENIAWLIQAKMGELKDAAMGANTRMVVASQVKRTEEETKMPSLFDLRDSGGIEASADTVLMLHMERDTATRAIGDVWLGVLKQRRGSQAKFRIGFDPERMRLYDAEV